MKILLIEDEVKLLRAMQEWLSGHNYTVHTAAEPKMGLALAKTNNYAVIVSDITMPQISGLDILRDLRTQGIMTPFILLTALGHIDDKIEGFEAGADDYLTKPFDFQELLLRIKALARRPVDTYINANVLTYSDIEMNIATKDFCRNGKKINLTPKEYELMEYFLRNPERVISKMEIADKVWQLDFETGTNVVEVYINFLRKKVETGFSQKLIHTQFKIGYILSEQN
jgi:two-component system, OmpR family, copper resistance phosphate regulon response regulator CusR